MSVQNHEKVHTELQAIAKLKPKADEDEQVYLKRLVNKVNGVFSEEEKEDKADSWNTLSAETQDWFNASLEAIDEEKPVASLNVVNGSGEEPKAAKKSAKKVPAKKVAKAEKEKPAKKVAAKKASAKKGAKKDTAGRGRKGSYPLEAKIKIVAKENPHREGTNLHGYFEKYENNMTVQEALDAGIVWENMRYLAEVGHIKIA